MNAPTFGVVRKPLRIPYVLRSTLAEDRDVSVTLSVDGESARTEIVRVPAMGQMDRSIFLDAGDDGRCHALASHSSRRQRVCDREQRALGENVGARGTTRGSRRRVLPEVGVPLSPERARERSGCRCDVSSLPSRISEGGRWSNLHREFSSAARTQSFLTSCFSATSASRRNS